MLLDHAVSERRKSDVTISKNVSNTSGKDTNESVPNTVYKDTVSGDTPKPANIVQDMLSKDVILSIGTKKCVKTAKSRDVNEK